MISAEFTNYIYENLPVISKGEKIFLFLFYPIDLFLKEKKSISYIFSENTFFSRQADKGNLVYDLNNTFSVHQWYDGIYYTGTYHFSPYQSTIRT